MKDYNICKSFADPDLVTGDFDSLDKVFLDELKKKTSVKVIQTINQDETDFTKAVREIKSHAINTNKQVICVKTYFYSF